MARASGMTVVTPVMFRIVDDVSLHVNEEIQTPGVVLDLVA